MEGERLREVQVNKVGPDLPKTITQKESSSLSSGKESLIKGLIPLPLLT